MRDYLGIIGFFVAVIAGALLINTFLFRSFSVSGPSMQPTLHTGDRLIVNRLHHTASFFTHKDYKPKRGEVVVFENPTHIQGEPGEFVVKRVIGYAGERVVVKDGKITVYNDGNSKGFDPDKGEKGPRYPTSGEADVVVPNDQLFVAGDNRVGNFSLDSRNGLGTIPLHNLQGPVFARIFPFTGVRLF